MIVKRKASVVHFTKGKRMEQADYIIPGLRAGQVGLVSAPGGTGKTFLLLEIAFSVASGKELINGIKPAAAGPVRVLNFEEDEFELECRGNVIWDTWPDLDLSGKLSVVCMNGVSLQLLTVHGKTRVDDLNWLLEVAKGMRLLILDPLRHVHMADENNAAMMAALMQILKYVAQETGCGILVAHHTSKAAVLNGQGDVQQSVRGSSALVDAARLVMTLAKPKGAGAGILELNWAKLNGHAPIQPVTLKRATGGVLVSIDDCCEFSIEVDERGKGRD